MFELLFSRPTAIARYRAAPLLDERLLYLTHCEQIGIRPETLCKIARYQLDLVHILDLRDDDASNQRKVEAGFRQWLLPEERKLRPRARRQFFGHCVRWMRFMGWLEEPKPAYHAHTREVTLFAKRMASEYGWSDSTIESCRRTVDNFSLGWKRLALIWRLLISRQSISSSRAFMLAITVGRRSIYMHNSFADSSGLQNGRGGVGRDWPTGYCRRDAMPARQFRKD